MILKVLSVCGSAVIIGITAAILIVILHTIVRLLRDTNYDEEEE